MYGIMKKIVQDDANAITNYIYCKECIDYWYTKSDNKTCPCCPKDIIYCDIIKINYKK